MDAATLNKRLSAAYNVGTTPRYMDFEKTGANMMMGEQANIYPTPYATLPVGAVGGEVSGTLIDRSITPIQSISLLFITRHRLFDSISHSLLKRLIKTIGFNQNRPNLPDNRLNVSYFLIGFYFIFFFCSWSSNANSFNTRMSLTFIYFLDLKFD